MWKIIADRGSQAVYARCGPPPPGRSRALVAVAAMLYEPYMVLQDGLLFTIDGRAELAVPIRAG